MEEDFKPDDADSEEVLDSDEGGADESSELVEQLSSVTGRKYESKEDAIKHLTELNSYVGKVGKYTPVLKELEKKAGGEDKALEMLKEMSGDKTAEDKPKRVSNYDNLEQKISQVQEQLEESQFYADHPEYKGVKDLISSLRPSLGGFDEVVKSDVFKKAFDGIKAGSEQQRSKSVLHSSPRLGAVRDKMAEAHELKAKGDYAGGVDKVVSAVLDAYEQK